MKKFLWFWILASGCIGPGVGVARAAQAAAHTLSVTLTGPTYEVKTLEIPSSAGPTQVAKSKTFTCLAEYAQASAEGQRFTGFKIVCGYAPEKGRPRSLPMVGTSILCGSSNNTGVLNVWDDYRTGKKTYSIVATCQ